MSKLNKIESVLAKDKALILADIVAAREVACKLVGADETESDETNSLDIRLCVEDNGAWIVRTGDVSYDQRHSPFCEADSIGPQSDPGECLERLIDGVLDQVAEREA